SRPGAVPLGPGAAPARAAPRRGGPGSGAAAGLRGDPDPAGERRSEPVARDLADHPRPPRDRQRVAAGDHAAAGGEARERVVVRRVTLARALEAHAAVAVNHERLLRLQMQIEREPRPAPHEPVGLAIGLEPGVVVAPPD